MKAITWVLFAALAGGLAWATGCSDTRNEGVEGSLAGDGLDSGFDAIVRIEPPAGGWAVVINEVSSTEDYVELFNRGDAVNLSGWSVVDAAWDPADPATQDHRHPLSAVHLQRGARLLVDDLPFGLGRDDALTLLDPNGEPADRIDWLEDESPVLCRLPDGTGVQQACRATPDAVNQGPEAAPPPDAAPPGRCGDGIREGSERCDGADLAGASCAGLGLAGTLGCLPDCSDFDRSGCRAEAGGALVLNEVTATGDDAIEFLNRGEFPVDLDGYAVADGAWVPDDPATADSLHRLGAEVLPPGGRRILRKGTDHAFGLGGSDSAVLIDPEGRVIDQTTWPEGAAEVSWCRFPDGRGAFATCVAATLGAANVGPGPAGVCGDGRLDDGEVCDGEALGGADCVAAGFDGGVLGCAEDCASLDTQRCTRRARVVINEVSSSGDDPIELLNVGAAPVDLERWAVADADFDPLAPEATADHLHRLSGVLAPGAYRVLLKDQDHPLGLGGADQVTLYDAAGDVVDRTLWAEGEAGVSWCRVPDGVGAFMACATPTLGGPNGP